MTPQSAADPDGPAGGLHQAIDDAVLVLTIDRPQAANALDAATRTALGEALQRASVDPDVRAVLLTATGSHAFCAGADLGARDVAVPGSAAGSDVVPGDMARRIAAGWQALVTNVLDCEKPVIAAVNGLAAGGGFSLVLAADLVVMADTARLIPAWVRRGLAPDAAAVYLAVRLVGPRVAKRLFLLGDDVSASRALDLGLADEVVAEDLTQRAGDLARRLAAGPTRALSGTKALVHHAVDLDRSTALREEAAAQEVLTGTRDAAEGVAAFLEHRPPRFVGR